MSSGNSRIHPPTEPKAPPTTLANNLPRQASMCEREGGGGRQPPFMKQAGTMSHLPRRAGRHWRKPTLHKPSFQKGRSKRNRAIATPGASRNKRASRPHKHQILTRKGERLSPANTRTESPPIAGLLAMPPPGRRQAATHASAQAMHMCMLRRCRINSGEQRRLQNEHRPRQAGRGFTSADMEEQTSTRQS